MSDNELYTSNYVIFTSHIDSKNQIYDVVIQYADGSEFQQRVLAMRTIRGDEPILRDEDQGNYCIITG